MRPLDTYVCEFPTITMQNMSTSAGSRPPRVVILLDWSSLPAFLTMPTGASGERCFRRMSLAMPRYSVLVLLLGLYMHVMKSPSAAFPTLSMIRSRGVIRSDRLTMTRSCISGAPRMDAADDAAVMPGTVSISMSAPISSASW